MQFYAFFDGVGVHGNDGIMALYGKLRQGRQERQATAICQYMSTARTARGGIWQYMGAVLAPHPYTPTVLSCLPSVRVPLHRSPLLAVSSCTPTLSVHVPLHRKARFKGRVQVEYSLGVYGKLWL